MIQILNTLLFLYMFFLYELGKEIYIYMIFMSELFPDLIVQTVWGVWLPVLKLGLVPSFSTTYLQHHLYLMF